LPGRSKQASNVPAAARAKTDATASIGTALCGGLGVFALVGLTSVFIFAVSTWMHFLKESVGLLQFRCYDVRHVTLVRRVCGLCGKESVTRRLCSILGIA
jgi:hypothetical protein